MKFALGIGLTNDCDLACAHCYRDTVKIDRLSLKHVKEVCELLPVKSVNFGVGENALHPEFRQVIHYLSEQKINITITSNGYSIRSLSDDDLKLFQDVEFSVDFPTDREQDAHRGVGNWRLVWDQVARCRTLGIDVAVIAVMMSTNYDRMADLARVAGEHGARFRVNVYQPVKTDSFCLTFDQFWSGFRGLFAETRLLVCNEPIVRAVLGLKGERRSGCGMETIRVTPQAELLPCVYWPDRTMGLEDLRRRGAGITESAVFRRVGTVPAFCQSCQFLETCGGGCASRRMIRGRLHSPDEYCPFVRGEEIRLPCSQAQARDFPKAASACTTLVDARGI